MVFLLDIYQINISLVSRNILSTWHLDSPFLSAFRSPFPDIWQFPFCLTSCDHFTWYPVWPSLPDILWPFLPDILCDPFCLISCVTLFPDILCDPFCLISCVALFAWYLVWPFCLISCVTLFAWYPVWPFLPDILCDPFCLISLLSDILCDPFCLISWYPFLSDTH